MNRREARTWVRKHWAAMLRMADMPDLPPEYEEAIEEVRGDECRRIATRIDRKSRTDRVT